MRRSILSASFEALRLPVVIWPGLEELFARLRFAFACQGFTLITGEVGSGKSAALRLFAQPSNGADHQGRYR